MTDQEPVFVLRGSDPFAAAAVDRYADHVESARGPAGVVAKAREVARRMRAWPKGEASGPAEVLPVAQPADDGTAEALAVAGVEPGDVIDIPGEGEFTFGKSAKRSRKS